MWFLKEFIKVLDNKDKEFEEKKDINQKNLLNNYKKSLSLFDNKVFNHKSGLFLDD